MEIDNAIMSFSQSEKAKAGLIWMSQTLGMLQGLPEGEKKGGEKVINALLNMIGHEMQIAEAVTGNGRFTEIQPLIEKATVMVNSGVGQEATLHLTKALSMITNIANQSMTLLKEKGLL